MALAIESPVVVNLHEWRKQSKYLWHVLQLTELAWATHEADLGDRVHELSSLLGTDHDLAVLRETLAGEPLTYGGHRALKSLFAIIDARRAELQRQAFALGRRLYADQPGVFTKRIEEYWTAWVPPTKAQSRPKAPAPPRRLSAS